MKGFVIGAGSALLVVAAVAGAHEWSRRSKHLPSLAQYRECMDIVARQKVSEASARMTCHSELIRRSVASEYVYRWQPITRIDPGTPAASEFSIQGDYKSTSVNAVMVGYEVTVRHKPTGTTHSATWMDRWVEYDHIEQWTMILPKAQYPRIKPTDEHDWEWRINAYYGYLIAVR